MTSSPPIAHVSDTARWVAMYRAMESERPDALFRDRFARKLAGEQGEEILRRLPKAHQFAWPMIVRTALMDQIILRTVSEDAADGVLNLAAGLDARAYRLPLPAGLRWVEADLPAVLDYKRGVLAGERPACALESVPVDLTDAVARQALFAKVGPATRRTLVITEGLLVYLQAEQVRALARDLHAQPGLRWWLMDLGSPRLLKMLERTLGTSLQRAPLRFAPAEGTAFFTPFGWREVEYRPIFEEAIRLNRTMRFARFWRFLFRFYPRKLREELKRMSGVVLLERT
jgi:methyltransferase (TIGR00027 family)